MESNNQTKHFLFTVAAGIAVYVLWEKWGRAFFLGKPGDLNGDGIPDSLQNLTVSPGAGTGGAGGAGGAGTGGGVGDYSALAAAINALANGVKLPNVQSLVKAVSAGTTEIVTAVPGKRICVLAYSASASGACQVSWRSGMVSLSDLWRMDLEAAAGKSGANIATAWPGYLFATQENDNLAVFTTGAATVSVTYWTEDL